MFRTEKSVGMLKSIAMIGGLAILMWSLGLPSVRFSEAANVTSFSDTISDSAPSASADHTIQYTVPAGSAGVEAGETITVTFPAGFNMGAVAFGDIDLSINAVDQTLAAAPAGATWGAVVAGQVLTLTSGTGVANAGEVVIIKIGTNATGGTNQIANHASEGSYDISVVSGTGGNNDTGTTKIVVLTSVTVTAAVDTIFTFKVEGTSAGTLINTQATTGAVGSTSMPFGNLAALTATTTAQLLTVNTNASNGYVVTVQVDGDLQSSTGATIDGYDLADEPTAWAAPVGTLGDPTTYGHWGVTSDDLDIESRDGAEFADDLFIAASTTPRDVMQHNSPINGVGAGEGTTTVGYRVEISALQEAGDDYSTTLTYVATPIF